jgi:hypothetical protein
MTIESDTPEVQAPRPQIPRLGPAASGLVALLLVGALFVIPFLGLLIAPLGSLPVLNYQSSGTSGYRAWGPVVVLLLVTIVAGFGQLTMGFLTAYCLLVVLPSLTVELWVRWGLSEGRWSALTVLAGTAVCVAAIVVATAPQTPMDGLAQWAKETTEVSAEISAAWGLEQGSMELALDAMQSSLPKVVPGVIIAYLAAVVFWLRPRLPLLGLPVQVAPFEEFRNDEWLAVVFVLAGVGTLVLDGASKWVAVNGLIAILILYFVQGLAMIRAHLARWFGRGLVLRWSVAFTCVFVPLMLFLSGVTDREAGLTGLAVLTMIAALGVVDSFHTLRPQADDGGTK